MINPQVFTIFRLLIEERTGLQYAADDDGLIGDKLNARALEAGFETLLDYYYYLRYDPDSAQEFSELVDSLVVNETYFFREFDAVRIAIDRVLLPALERQPRVRVWSAACSTGEEPFTLAMALAERGILSRVELLATDVSERALRSARSGIFRPRSLRTPELPELARPFIELKEGKPVVHPKLRDAIRFEKLNLMDSSALAKLGQFELILCRNVLIYFSDATIQRLVGDLTRALRPDGALLVGTSESLLRFSTELRCEEMGGSFVYKRPSDG